MPSPTLMIIVGAVAALIVGFFFVRYPRWRWRIALGGVAVAGLAAFVTWYTLFRIDDAKFVADKAAAEQQQANLDKLFDDPPAAAAQPAPATPAPSAAEPVPTAPPAPPTPPPDAAHALPDAGTPAPPRLVGGREKELTPTAPAELGTLPDGVGIPVGQVAPDVSLTGLDGAPTQLSTLLTSRPLLLVFYRGGWCPFCNKQVHEYSLGYARLQALGVDVAFVSVDTPEAGRVTQASWTVPFPLLSDPDAVAHEAFHVVNALDKAGYERLVGFGLDIEAWSGRTHHKIAIPAIFLLDTDRTVLWAHAAGDYTVRPTRDQLLPALQAALATRHGAAER